MSDYVMPSQCEQRVVTVTHAEYVTHYAHETDCTHARKDPTK
jgi:hypothetical protein